MLEINAVHDEHLAQYEGSFDAYTHFGLTFFENFRYSELPYGDA